MSQFLVSPQDDIMRIFGGDRLFSIFNSPMFASLPEDEPLLESKMLTKRIDGVQKQVEGHNFDVRKHILEYDDVMNNHRIVIYSRRDKILDNDNIHERILEIAKNNISDMVENMCDEAHLENGIELIFWKHIDLLFLVILLQIIHSMKHYYRRYHRYSLWSTCSENRRNKKPSSFRRF